MKKLLLLLVLLAGCTCSDQKAKQPEQPSHDQVMQNLLLERFKMENK